MRHPLILLAAGDSTRAGQPKGLIEVYQKPWLLHQIEAFERLDGRELVLVFGNHFESYAKTFEWLRESLETWRGFRSISVAAIINPHPELGQFSSLQSALKFLELSRAAGAFVCPVDVPLPQKKTLTTLEMNFTPSLCARIPTYQSRGGHPVLLSADFMRRLLSLSPSDVDARLDRQIQRLSPNEIDRIEIEDPNLLANMNYIEDYLKRGIPS